MKEKNLVMNVFDTSGNIIKLPVKGIYIVNVKEVLIK